MQTKYCKSVITGKRCRYTIEPDGNYFVFGKRSRTKGYRYTPSSFSAYFIQEETDETNLWQKRMTRAVRAMDESGLWPEINEIYRNLLQSGMTWQDKTAMSEIYNRHRGHASCMTEMQPYIKKYPFIYDGKNLLLSYFRDELSECRVKTMYFGKWYNKPVKEMLADAIAEKKPFQHRNTAGYDVSVQYAPEKNKLWYSEEFRGCGNGHYYIGLNAGTAVFVEND